MLLVILNIIFEYLAIVELKTVTTRRNSIISTFLILNYCSAMIGQRCVGFLHHCDDSLMYSTLSLSVCLCLSNSIHSSCPPVDFTRVYQRVASYICTMKTV